MAECVQCGYCCTVSPCPYGKWDELKKQCAFLTEANLCAKYVEILKHPGSEMSPAFGSSCSSSLFNTRREEILRKRANAL